MRPELRDKPAHNYVSVAGSETHYKGAIFDVVADHFSLGESTLRREYMLHDDAVAVLVLREGERGEEVLLIRQYRHPIRHVMWEIPAGLLDIEGEGPEEAARRELYEEADMVGGELTQLLQMYSSPGCSTEMYTIYSARGCKEADVPFERSDEEADIQRFWLPLTDVVAAVRAGDLRSPTLVSAVLAYISQ